MICSVIITKQHGCTVLYLKTFVKSANSGKWQSLNFFESKPKINGFLIFFAVEQILRREKKNQIMLWRWNLKLVWVLRFGFFEVRQVQLSVFGYFTQCSDSSKFGFGKDFSPCLAEVRSSGDHLFFQYFSSF